MFAVPGWNISTQSPVQELGKPVNNKSRQGNTSQENPSARSRKRKRNQGTQQLISGANTTPLNQIRTPSQNHTSSHEPNKRPKPNDSHASTQSPALNTHSTDRDSGAPKGAHQRRTSRSESSTRAGHSHGEEARSSKSQAKKRDRQGKQDANKASKSSNDTDPSHNKVVPRTHILPLPALPPGSTTLTPLQAKMRAKLTSARFRYINETLYTTSSTDALQLFADSPDLFADYHAGFSQQVKDSWPQNPVEVYVADLKSRGSLASPSNNLLPLPRRRHGVCHIADLGCGDAPLARALQPVKNKLNLKFVSFDLHTPNEYVTKADISALPLGDGDADLAIFCLSLMGTNWLSFVEEAWRVLRGDGKGEVWVSEVKSRFGRLSAKQGFRKVVANSVGKRQKPQAASNKSRMADVENEEDSALVEDEREASKPGADDDTDLEPFINSFLRRGFALREGSIDKSNRMFVSMVFTKVGVPRAGKWKGAKWNGKAYERINQERPRKGTFGPRFHRGSNATNEDDEIDEEGEGKLLKPCVYKLR